VWVASLVAAVAAPAAARAATVPQRVAAQGVAVEIVELPDEFVAGARPETVTVVASKRAGQECLKVRWSMVLQLEGLTLEQVRVDRVEDDGSFPVDVSSEGSSARITDEQLDPGTLCQDRTVTARYELNVAQDVGSGRLTVLTEAYDAELRLLERDGATRSVVGDGGAAEPTPTAGPDASAPADDTGAAAPPAEPGAPGVDQAGNDAAADQDGIPLAWFLIGGLMVFLGLSLLLNVRWRQRETAVPEPDDLDPDGVEPLEPAGAPTRYQTSAYEPPDAYRATVRRTRRWS
jgi:hypothetical protein